jgi:stage II sporulation protein M
LTEQQPKKRSFTGDFFGKYTDYARGLRPIFLICCFLFLFSLAMGYALGGNLSENALQDLLGTLPNIQSMSRPQIFAFIAANNTLKSLLFMFGGLIGGVLPLFFVIFNGFTVGWVAYDLGTTQGLGYVVAGLTPHGIVEIPAILLAMSMGMSLGYTMLNNLRGQGSVVKEAKTAFGFFVTRVFPLLILAAVVEVLITPLVIVLLGYA